MMELLQTLQPNARPADWSPKPRKSGSKQRRSMSHYDVRAPYSARRFLAPGNQRCFQWKRFLPGTSLFSAVVVSIGTVAKVAAGLGMNPNRSPSSLRGTLAPERLWRAIDPLG